jgi:negative regulator of flagellin synthesis FlgM
VKIDQNSLFPKPMADTSSVLPAKDGVNASLSLSRVPSATSQEQSLSATTMLPSTNGDFDAGRVDEIRDDISSGRYKVNTDKIADGLLASVRDLIARKTT